MRREPDRDRTVERLLRESLKASASSVASADCLDPERLAAWADGTLTPDELPAAEAHLSDCSRCQALLAAMIRSAPAEALRLPWWRRRWVLRVLVPATAAAAAVTLWIAIPRDDHRGSIEHGLARASANAALPPAARVPPRGEPQALAEQKSASGIAKDKSRTRADELGNKTKAQTAEAARTLDAASSPGERRAAAPVTARQAASPRAELPPAPPPTAAAGAAPTAAAAAARGAAPANAAQLSRDSTSALMAKAASPGMVAAEIVAPDRLHRWRPGPAGSLVYSSDGGSTWQTLSTGVSADLTAGASPSSSVCWLVGRGGTVLLSTDGLRWQRVAFPAGVDLIAVSAADARTATITAADGRRFTTVDGGLTWRQP